MANIIGTKGNDTLVVSQYDGTNDTLTGGGGQDKFIYTLYYMYMYNITDFSGIGTSSNPSAAVITEVDTLIFQDIGFTARNFLLTQNGNNLEISFDGDITDDGEVIGTDYDSQDISPFLFEKPIVTLQNFTLENLDNLSTLGNILFYGQTSIKDSFDVVNANSTQQNPFNKNTVTFFNDLNNYVIGFDNSNDVINGQGGNDSINGLSGNDLLRGGAGNDTLMGDVGDDSLKGNTGNDLLLGGTGNDTLIGGVGNDTLKGGSGKDTLNVYGSTGDNLLSGGDGNDSLSASHYFSFEEFGYFAETIYFTSGNNTLKGGDGNDTLDVKGSTGDNLLFGGDGNDSLSASGYRKFDGSFVYYIVGNNTLNGGTGNDTLNANSSTGDNLLSGDDGNDYLSASSDYGRIGFSDSSGNNTLNGGDGNDILDVQGTGDNLLSGGDGNDSLSASGEFESFLGIYKVVGNNILNGGTGNDTLNVDISEGDNLLSGGDDDDYLSASGYFGDEVGYNLTASGNNTLNGGAGKDTLKVDNSRGDNLLSGGNGNDFLSALGASGNNTLNGGAGSDILIGGKGNDALYGGNGADTFVFNSYNEGVDSIYDFNNATNEGVDSPYESNATNEYIQIGAAGFGGQLSIGVLSASQFTLGTSATTIAQRFIYDNSTGALYFDQDGSANAFTQVKFAQFFGGVSLSEKVFYVTAEY
ncbi:calcium-binding protein [Nostoc sp. UHCC 0251]|uniref:calcium-binding protein n=1 Tax=Nostoc sp. UHCC 0251 TaxID=3110240 RepID=UPI002B21C5FC|nr:calcium-binding protein [Nostoc sp. UHCC 0251]MEA5624524.1 calcium-binding protein [Nostoc sp. UHCC 0251]